MNQVVRMYEKAQMGRCWFGCRVVLYLALSKPRPRVALRSLVEVGRSTQLEIASLEISREKEKEIVFGNSVGRGEVEYLSTCTCISRCP